MPWLMGCASVARAQWSSLPRRPSTAPRKNLSDAPRRAYSLCAYSLTEMELLISTTRQHIDVDLASVGSEFPINATCSIALANHFHWSKPERAHTSKLVPKRSKKATNDGRFAVRVWRGVHCVV